MKGVCVCVCVFDSLDPWTVACMLLVHGILKARLLQWVAITFSRGSFWPRDRTQVSCNAGRVTWEGQMMALQRHKIFESEVKVKLLSCVWLFATPWTIARQAPPSMGFSRQEYWSGVPSPSPRSHRFMANRWGNNRNRDRLYFLGLQNHCGQWLQPWN